jgi:hypothetical protein
VFTTKGYSLYILLERAAQLRAKSNQGCMKKVGLHFILLQRMDILRWLKYFLAKE